MANYIYFDNTGKNGKRAISVDVFDQLVTNALSHLDNISMSASKMKRNQKIRLNRPVQTSIRHGIVHVSVSIDVKSDVKIQETCREVQDEVVKALMISAEQVPFDVQVKVDNILA